MLKTRKNNKNRIFKLGFLVLFLVLFFGYLKFNFFAQASDERIDIYPQSFRQENNASEFDNSSLVEKFFWQKGENSFGRENNPETDFSVFSEINSAYIYFGEGDLSTSTSEISALPEVGSSTLPDVTEKSSSTMENSAPLLKESSTSPVQIEEPKQVETGEPAVNSNDSGNVPVESENPVAPVKEEINTSSGDSTSIAPIDDNSALVNEIQPGITHHLPESAPASAESSSDSAPEESSPVVPSDPGSSESQPSAPVSLFNSLKAAGKDLSYIWKRFVSMPKVNAEKEDVSDLSASSSIASSTSSEKNLKAVELKNSLVFSDFNLGSYFSDSEITNVQLRLSVAAESNFSFDHLLVEYSFGDGWQEAGDLFLKGGISNNANGGYFLFALPIFSSWEDIDNLQIRVSYANNEISETDLKTKAAKVYLDGLWLEVDYNRGKVKGEKEINKANQNEEVIPGTEQHFWNEGPLEVDGKEISFDHTDESSNENLLIRSDRKDYAGLSQAEVYLSITNIGSEDENFGWQAYFPDTVGRVTSLEKFSRRYETAETPVYGTLNRFCAVPWQAIATGTEKEYQCLDNGKTEQCDSLSRDKKKCRQENVVVGQAPETKNVNEWTEALVRPGKLTDKRNVLEKIFGMGPKKKLISSNFVPKTSTEAESYLIAPGETQYFRMEINFTLGSEGEFYLEAVGDKQGYGLLDPWWNANWN
jgi:hypothetical protein